ncbi:chorismate synthase [candidate division MSBL1 archaeon SCGC-AAA261D19]|uniref:Chorismate synthase n=1 Tax=candidate division MSBL1 archaeon SCGC-AAA261D19 TaxID=1698273 RepID=A0A133V6Y6_9EURY|nr:chorismate synthase [candidate division MSBL1 archaeon SCGC-AAA261D19]
MSGNTFGKIFKITTWGESHGAAVGVVVDGVPSGIPLKEKDIQKELDRRRPGKAAVSTPREERDKVHILSGVFGEKTLGTPISMLVQNIDVDSEPYEAVKSKPRPGHADLTYWLKYGRMDYRGGGRASGRETVGRVAGGAIAKKILGQHGVEILGHTIEAAGVKVGRKVKVEEIRENVEKNSMRCADPEVAERMKKKVLEAEKQGDSTGGVVEIRSLNVPPGLGEPVFEKLDAEISKALMSIGAVKGVEIGLGFGAAERLGSEMIDEFEVESGKIVSKTNRAGGILGGISTGMPIVARIAVKPPSSISKPTKTVNLETMENTELKLKGRFDPNICPRIVPVAESMVALVLADHMLRSGKFNPDHFGGAK